MQNAQALRESNLVASHFVQDVAEILGRPLLMFPLIKLPPIFPRRKFDLATFSFLTLNIKYFGD